MKNMNNHNLEVTLSRLNTKQVNLNPSFVTGLIEAEGYFSITKHKDDRAKYKFSVILRFKLTMLSNMILILQLTLSGIKLWKNIIFNHFSEYPLHGTKYIKLKQLFIIKNLMTDSKHLMQVGKSR
jgi:hypothetical protein